MSEQKCDKLRISYVLSVDLYNILLVEISFDKINGDFL